MACCFKLSPDKTEVNERAVYKDDGNIDNFDKGFSHGLFFLSKTYHGKSHLYYINQ